MTAARQVSPMSGRCLCGAVRFSGTPAEMHMDACHCSFCRRWSAGPFMSVNCPDLTVEDDSALATFSSSEHAERQFCGKCGSTLFWRMKDGSMIAVSAQAFDDPSGLPLEIEIFVDEKPSTYDFANPTQKMTGAEVVAAFAGSNANG